MMRIGAIVPIIVLFTLLLFCSETRAQECIYNDETFSSSSSGACGSGNTTCEYSLQDDSTTVVSISSGGNLGVNSVTDNEGNISVSSTTQATYRGSDRNFNVIVYSTTYNNDGSVSSVSQIQLIDGEAISGTNNNHFGEALAISRATGDTLVAGPARFFRTIYIFKWNDNTNSFDLFQSIPSGLSVTGSSGTILDISDDGNTVVKFHIRTGYEIYTYDGSSYAQHRVAASSDTAAQIRFKCNRDCSKVVVARDDATRYVRYYYDFLNNENNVEITPWSASCWTDEINHPLDLDENRLVTGCPDQNQAKVYTIDSSTNPPTLSLEQTITYSDITTGSCGSIPIYYPETTSTTSGRLGSAIYLGKTSPSFLYIGDYAATICTGGGNTQSTGYVYRFVYNSNTAQYEEVTRDPTAVINYPQYACSGTTCSNEAYGWSVVSTDSESFQMVGDPQGTSYVSFYAQPNQLTASQDLLSNQTLCANGTSCSAPSYCTGDNSTCPPNELYNSTVVCHEPQGPCEIAVTCTGDNATCPERQFHNSTYECRSAGVCADAAFCIYGNETCPEPEYYNSTVQCFDSQDICLEDAFCSGDAAECPQPATVNDTYCTDQCLYNDQLITSDLFGPCLDNITCTFDNLQNVSTTSGVRYVDASLDVNFAVQSRVDNQGRTMITTRATNRVQSQTSLDGEIRVFTRTDDTLDWTNIQVFYASDVCTIACSFANSIALQRTNGNRFATAVAQEGGSVLIYELDEISGLYNVSQTISSYTTLYTTDPLTVTFSDDAGVMVVGGNNDRVDMFLYNGTHYVHERTFLNPLSGTSLFGYHVACNTDCSKVVVFAATVSKIVYYYEALVSDAQTTWTVHSSACETPDVRKHNIDIDNARIAVACAAGFFTKVYTIDDNDVSQLVLEQQIDAADYVEAPTCPSGLGDGIRRHNMRFGGSVLLGWKSPSYLYFSFAGADYCVENGGNSNIIRAGSALLFIYESGSWQLVEDETEYQIDISCATDASCANEDQSYGYNLDATDDLSFVVVDAYDYDFANTASDGARGKSFWFNRTSALTKNLNYESEGTICTNGTSCSADAVCNGTSDVCPERELYNSTVQCFTSDDICLEDAFCTLNNTECPQPATVNDTYCTEQCLYNDQLITSDLFGPCLDNITCEFGQIENATMNQKLTNDQDNFGMSLIMSNSGGIVIATSTVNRRYSSTDGDNKIYVYERDDDDILQNVQVLFATEQCGAGCTYGQSISVAREKGDIFATVDKTGEGTLYIYKWSDVFHNFTELQTFTNYATGFSNFSPASVAISDDGSTIAVGGNNDRILLYRYNGSAYAYIKTLPNPSETTTFFGYYLDMTSDGARVISNDIRESDAFYYYDAFNSNDYTFINYYSDFCDGFDYIREFADMNEKAILFGCRRRNRAFYYEVDQNDVSVLNLVQTLQGGNYFQTSSCPSGQGDGVRLMPMTRFGISSFLGRDSPSYFFIGDAAADFCVESGGSSTIATYGAAVLFVHDGTEFVLDDKDETLYTIDDNCLSNPTTCDSTNQRYGRHIVSTDDLRYTSVNAISYNSQNGTGAVFNFNRTSALSKTLYYESKGTICTNGTSCSADAVCNGTSDICPDVEVYNSTVVCHEPQGPCEIAVNCTGNSTECPARQFYNSTFLCSAGNNCSAPSYCTYGNETCPPNEPLGSNVTVHEPQGPCERQVNCSANSTVVPAREFFDSNYTCSEAENCTAASTCTFGNETCPAGGPIGNDTIIHFSQGPCEMQVNCSANSTVVPPREFFGSDYVCDLGGNCTANATCTLGNETCPVQQPIGNDTIIHEPQGPCEVQVNCSANSTVVPPREFFGADYVCELGGNCTANATCTFGNETCPVQQPIGNDTIIHEPQGPCEMQVNCTANSTAIPPREFFGADYVCDLGGNCTANSTCTFGNETCPAQEPIGETIIIHEPQGPCEKQVNCSANSTVIPPREFYGSDFVCAVGGNCTANATCTFGNETCPEPGPIGGDVIIHEPQGPCEIQVNCSANSTVVPPREFFGTDYVCELGGNCTANATCTFGNETCPVQQPIGNDTIIHEPQGPCEMQVNCSANSTVVPPREFFGADYLCNAGGNCTANATCTFGNETCPFGGPAGADIVVHFPQGPCEKEVNCTGNSTAIPPREFYGSDFVCDLGGNCTANATCTLGNETCPAQEPIGNETIIHEPQGPCEMQVNCSANSTAIPPREFFGADYVCDLGGNCTANATCTFGNETCPAQEPIGNDTIIHEPQGPCEMQVNCSANSTAIPSREFFGADYVCDVGGNCTANSTCTFGNETCPAQEPIGETVVIHEPQGPCEIQVNCSANSTAVPPREFRNSTYMCRNATNCTAAAFCIYGNATCPSPEPAGADVIIHEPQGPCEMQVNCSANSTVVPPRQFYGSDFVCELGGNCTANATCTFGNETCPAQSPADNDTIIHFPQGPCELQVNCSGTNTSVPTRQFRGTNYTCLAANNCSSGATCSFGNETCPDGTPAGDSVIVHVPQGPCERQVNCSSNSTVVPPREFFGSNYVCELGGNCTANATCTFGNETCPAPPPAGPDVIIHEPQGPCEKQVNCSSGSTVAPPRQFFGSGYVCDVGSNCTANATCTFGNETCPAKGPAGDDVIIHEPQGACEKQVNCTGNSTIVPPREFYGPSFQCAMSTNSSCQSDSFCTFGNATCPPSTADNSTLCHNETGCSSEGFCNPFNGQCEYTIFSAGTVCRNATFQCEGDAKCLGGTNEICPANPISPAGTTCASNIPVTPSICTTPGRCNGTSRICPNSTVVPDGTPCIPGTKFLFAYPLLECFEQGECSTGSCVGGGAQPAGTVCNPGGYLCAYGECDRRGTCVTTDTSKCTEEDIFVN